MREIELKPSLRLGLLLLGMVLLALVAIGLAALPDGVRLALAAGVTGLAAWGWRQVRLTGVWRVAADGRLQSSDGTGEWCDIEVQGDSLVSPALVVLRYRPAGERRVRSLALLPDSAAAGDLRRLRVSLRWLGHTRSDIASRDAD